jgi:hypothetical protein
MRKWLRRQVLSAPITLKPVEGTSVSVDLLETLWKRAFRAAQVVTPRYGSCG